ncbi:hypothetical protein [Phenylobacterium sp.]|uniref:helix-turn-helix transcriptional regulator n=1 Tax=Phenylobacterium sp. TaxID=1871053 RepID=UPI0025EDE1BC|nr:hypothetical protein [Phenylobacterium sp.]
MGQKSAKAALSHCGRPPRPPRQTIAAIDAGKYSPSLKAAFRIARVFGASVEDVFQWRD